MINIFKRIEEAKKERERQKQIKLEKEEKERAQAERNLRLFFIICFSVLIILGVYKNEKDRIKEIKKQEEELRKQIEYEKILNDENFGYDFSVYSYHYGGNWEFYLIDFDRRVKTAISIKPIRHSSNVKIKAGSCVLEECEDNGIRDEYDKYYLVSDNDKKYVRIVKDNGDEKVQECKVMDMPMKYLKEYIAGNSDFARKKVLMPD